MKENVNKVAKYELYDFPSDRLPPKTEQKKKVVYFRIFDLCICARDIVFSISV